MDWSTPKSRGRRKATSSKPVRRSPLPPRRSDLLLRDARQLTGLADPLMAETLGQQLARPGVGEREAEHLLCMEVTGRASTTPSPHGLAAIAALARVAPATDLTMLAETIDILEETQPPPPWHTAASADTEAILDAAQRTALPDVLRKWLAYALDQRDAHLPEFAQAFDDDTSWGPAKQIAAALTDQGVDLTDRQAVDDAIRALNAERLARRLLP
ncbi:hypothetical protein ACFWYW_13920 [Nonomuraea sp. NPDC059023]|uniref:hypothetical protein n=1 Tax=unclassified Nonomuraea TaxID=2593643 RepID=UPI0036BBA72F